MHMIYQAMGVHYSEVRARDVCAAAHVKQPTQNEPPNDMLMQFPRVLLSPPLENQLICEPHSSTDSRAEIDKMAFL